MSARYVITAACVILFMWIPGGNLLGMQGGQGATAGEPERLVERLVGSGGAGAARAELLAWSTGVEVERADRWIRLVAVLDLLPPEVLARVARTVLAADRALTSGNDPGHGSSRSAPVDGAGSGETAGPGGPPEALARAVNALVDEARALDPDAGENTPERGAPGVAASGGVAPGGAAPGEAAPEGAAPDAAPRPAPALLSLAAHLAGQHPSLEGQALELHREVATRWPADPRAPEAALEASRRLPPEEARPILDAFLVQHPSHPLAPEARRLLARRP